MHFSKSGADNFSVSLVWLEAVLWGWFFSAFYAGEAAERGSHILADL